MLKKGNNKPNKKDEKIFVSTNDTLPTLKVLLSFLLKPDPCPVNLSKH